MYLKIKKKTLFIIKKKEKMNNKHSLEMISELPEDHPFYNEQHDINSDRCINTADLEHESPLFIKRNGFVYKKQLSRNKEYTDERKRLYMQNYRKKQKEKNVKKEPNSKKY